MNCGSAIATADHVRRKTLSAVEATRAALDRLAAIDAGLHAFLDVTSDDAIEAAGAIDRRVAAGEDPGPLAGVPVALKDNICVAGGRTTCGSRLLENYRSPFSATAVERLFAAGAVVIGKTNLDEFAMGSSTEHSAFGPTRNPWDVARVPGGSSGGSAAAVAAGIVPLALGSDTGGSIRQPASHCGIVGMKPTYGRISRYGLVAFASSLDQIGPLTRSVADAALALNVLCGLDPRDATSANRPAEDFTRGLSEPVSPLRIGVPRQAQNPANHPAVTAAMGRCVELFAAMGAEIVDVDLPHTDYGIAAYYIVAPAEASSNLARFDGVRYGRRAALAPGEGLLDLYCKSRAEGFGAEVQRRIMLGTYVLSAGYYDAYYLTALKVRRKIWEDHDAAFRSGCDALLMPATAGPAFRLGEKVDDPLALYLEDLYTVGVNLAGLPGIVLPAALADADGVSLPIGVQLVGPAWGEHRLLRVAAMLERGLAWQHRPPT